MENTSIISDFVRKRKYSISIVVRKCVMQEVTVGNNLYYDIIPLTYFFLNREMNVLPVKAVVMSTLCFVQPKIEFNLS